MIIGTAGHIDHGKSALVTALTGIAVDRLAEERRRGITIDLNFAPLRWDGLPPAGLVDVPGHEDFVRTMVAGASGIDLVLLVVDAAQGPEAQTWEHLAIVEQLGIARGIPVIAKADLVERDWLELVLSELTARLARSTVAFEDPVVTSAVTGLGMPELRERLRQHATALGSRGTNDLLRLPVDRAFSLAGVGTVVTGTPWSGRVRVGDTVRLLPSGRTARVRTIEAYGESRGESGPGIRTAVGLAGVDRLDVRRGDVLVASGDPWAPTVVIDAEISLLESAPRVDRRTRLRVHLGTAELLARVFPRGPIEPGGRGLLRLVLETPAVARGGDRLVLRSYSPVTTIGGGRVVDPLPPRHPGWSAGLAADDAAERLEALVLRRRDGVAPEELPVLLGVVPEEARRVAGRVRGLVLVEDRWIPESRYTAAREALLSRVDLHHTDHPSSPGLSLETLRRVLRSDDWMADAVIAGLAREGALRARDGIVAREGFEPRSGGGEPEVERAVEALRAAGLEPPTVPELESRLGLKDLRGALRVAAGRGLVEAIETDRFCAVDSLDRFAGVLRELGAGGAEISPPAVRERTGLSRKFLIPLLEWADRRAVTRRDATGRRTLK